MKNESVHHGYSLEYPEINNRHQTAATQLCLGRFASSAVLLAGSLGAYIGSEAIAPSIAYAETPQVVIGAPFEGLWAFDAKVKPPYTDANSSHPSVHARYGFDWATDLYPEQSNSEVKVMGKSPQGKVTFKRNSTSDTCSSYGKNIAGYGITLDVLVNSKKVGEVKYDHLDLVDIGSEPVASGTKIGAVTKERIHPSCFQNSHTHVQLKNTEGSYACYVDLGDTATKFYSGDDLGVLGSINNGPQQKCASVPSGSGEAAPKIDNTVKRIIKKNSPDGTNLMFWAKSGSVFESWYKPGGDGVHHTNIAEITQQDVRDIDVQLNADGQRLVYTATPHNILETNYYPGKGIKSAGIIHDDADIRKILKSKDPDGSEQLYVLTDGGVDEYEWHPGGEITKRRIFSLKNPVDMEKVVAPDGTQELYVADSSYVYENIWKDDGAVKQGTPVLHIPQADITDIDFSRGSDNLHQVYAGRRQDGVWEASWKPGSVEGISTWQVTGDNGVRSIEKWQDGNTEALYLATAGGVLEYYWPRGTKNVRGGVITQQADIQDIDRATTTDGAQAVYTAANTQLFESYWFSGGDGIHTKPIA